MTTGRTPEPLRTPYHNLPAPRSTFVGREREMMEVMRAVAITRLLTLTGTGGSGKTRLALEAARDLIESYPDGVWLVELAPLSEEALVPKALAEALEVPERHAEPLSDTLAEVLRDRQLLLVLDNCEHLLEATARLVDKLLDSCPRLRILATSREALGVQGEMRWPVPPLSVPEPRGMPSSDEIEGYESVRLFVERARGRDPSFSLSPHNARAVAEICHMLEGIPLAIELAAARAACTSIPELLVDIAGRFPLLDGGRRPPDEQEATVRAAVEWACEQLTEDERAVLDHPSEADTRSLAALARRGLVSTDGTRWWVHDAIRHRASSRR